MARYEIVLEGRQGIEDMLTVLHYELSGTAPYDWQAMADLIRLDIVDNLQSVLVPNASYVGITVREDMPGSVGVFIPFTLGAIAGTVVDPDNITQVAALVRKTTGTLTRPNKGRVFQGGITARLANTVGSWEPALMTALEAFWNDMLTISFSGPSTATMVIKASDPTQPNTVEQNVVNFMSVAPLPSTLKRRKRGIGS